MLGSDAWLLESCPHAGSMRRWRQKTWESRVGRRQSHPPDSVFHPYVGPVEHPREGGDPSNGRPGPAPQLRTWIAPLRTADLCGARRHARPLALIAIRASTAPLRVDQQGPRPVERHVEIREGTLHALLRCLPRLATTRVPGVVASERGRGGARPVPWPRAPAAPRGACPGLAPPRSAPSASR